MRKINGLRILGPARGDPRLPVYGVNIDGKDNGVLARDLVDRYGIETRPGLHCAPAAHKTIGTYPDGTIRFAPGIFMTDDDVRYALDAAAQLARRSA